MFLFPCSEFFKDKHLGFQDCFVDLVGPGSCGLARETSWSGWSTHPPEKILQQCGVG